MGTAFSYNDDDFKLRLVQGLKDKNIRNADEIMDTIKEYRLEISEQIDNLEAIRPITSDIERQIAVLIRQDQYLEVLENKQKYELAEIFFDDDDNNCIVPDVLQWYKGAK